MAETFELRGSAVAVDGAPLQAATKDPRLSSHDPDVRMRTAQHQSERTVLAQGGAHVDPCTGRQA